MFTLKDLESLYSPPVWEIAYYVPADYAKTGSVLTPEQEEETIRRKVQEERIKREVERRVKQLDLEDAINDLSL
jgi:hypothetical protein